MTAALDRPIWHALRTAHAELAEGGHLALRYHADFAPFAAACNEDAESLCGLAQLVPQDKAVILLQSCGVAAPPGTIAEFVAPAVQMIATGIAMPAAPERAIRLRAPDVQEMLALATLTKPGPFLPKTHLLGDFFGIKVNGRLVAMAGERMKLDGFAEVSAVCTHPDFRGKGFGGFLTQLVAARITQKGETPFLHAFASNMQAIKLYETLGFALRRTMTVTVLRRKSGQTVNPA